MGTLTSTLETVNSRLAAIEARKSLFNFTKHTFPDYQENWHNRDLCAILDQFARGEIRYLIVEMPPRHGKSELVSRRLPAYLLGLNPNEQLIACSYAASLAQNMNRDVQRIIDDERYFQVFPDTTLNESGYRVWEVGNYLRNQDLFEIVGYEGKYRAAGVGGGITGLGFTKGIIDDYVKNAEEAESITYRNKLWNWYTSTFYTRMEKNASILITATRWHEDDLIGRILKSPDAGEWVRINYPAIKESNPNELDKREPGAPLWPYKFPLERLKKIKTAVGSRVFQSLYQQNPTAAEGNIFKREWWNFYKELPKEKIIRKVQSWDTAFKKGEDNDFSVCTTWNQYKSGYYLTHLFHEQIEFPELKKQVILLNNRFKPHNILIEDKASGQSLIQELTKETTLSIKPIKVDTDKISRANAATPTIEAKNIYLPEMQGFTDEIIEECSAFPNAAHDDIVDSITQFINWIRGKVQIAPRIATSSGVINKNLVSGFQHG